MVTFDFHAHAFTDDIAEKLIGKMEQIYGIKRRHNATITELLASAHNAAIDKVIVLPIANRPEHIRYNDWYAELGATHEAIIPFGSIHPDNSAAELDRFPALGLRGIKFQPNAQKFYPDDRRMFPIYERAAENNLIVVFHAGHEEGGVEGEFSQPERFVDVITSFPDLTIVLAHFGGYKVWDKIKPVLGFENVYFDTAHMPGVIDEQLFLTLASEIGFDRIVFGTDFPFHDHATERAYIERVFGEKASKLISENPARILGMDATASGEPSTV
ncbi:MAG TPA: amidohydrolase family protein [Candidatus Aquicultor sp.]|jgi:hypothetical protein